MTDRSLTDEDFRLAFSIDRFCWVADIGRTTTYAEIKAGRLPAIKCGRRTLIRRQDAEAWLERLAERQEEAD